MLEALTAEGYLKVTVERGRLHYALWEGDAPREGVWRSSVGKLSQKRRGMVRRQTLYLPVMLGTLATAVVACAAALLAVSEKAEATFPGKNGRIAYAAFDFDRGPDDTIYTINPGGGAKTQLTRGYQPSYSPNGKKITYVGPDSEIYTINIGGDAKTQLTHNNTDEFTPDYSPDGRRIVYAGLEGLERNDAESDIYTIKASGGGKTQVTTNDNVDDLHPTYSPDGKKIAYTRIISRDAGPPISDIYTINASGGGGKFPVTHTNALFESGPSWGRRP